MRRLYGPDGIDEAGWERAMNPTKSDGRPLSGSVAVTESKRITDGVSGRAPVALTCDTAIRDGELYRFDWDGSPRFYLVRIYPWDPREAPSHPHLYTPRVQVRVELEGDSTAWAKQVCDDDPESINEAVLDCVFEIEQDCADVWEAEQARQKREMEADYWRSR